MRKNLLEFLFEMPESQLNEEALGENVLRLFEEAAKEEATDEIKCDKKPLTAALKAIGISAEVTASNQWCEICFDNDADYREATTKLTDPDALYKLAEAGWVPVKCGDQAMSNEDPCFRIGFIEIQVPEVSDGAKPEDAEKIRKEAQKSDLKEGTENETVVKSQGPTGIKPIFDWIVRYLNGTPNAKSFTVRPPADDKSDVSVYWGDKLILRIQPHYSQKATTVSYYTGQPWLTQREVGWEFLTKFANKVLDSVLQKFNAKPTTAATESLEAQVDALLEMTSAGAIPMACDVPARPPLRSRGTKKQTKRDLPK